MSIKEQVRNGVQFFNSHNPDWFRLIDIEKLNIGLVSYCVVGQIFDLGRYTTKNKRWEMFDKITNKMGLTSQEDVEGHGLYATNATHATHEDKVTAEKLNAEWKRVISSMQKKSKSKVQKDLVTV